MDCGLSNSNFNDVYNISRNCVDNLNEIQRPVTAALYFTSVLVCVAFTIITQYKYNSIKVFNLIVRTKSISNLTWIVYFVFVTSRCIMYTAVYCRVESGATDVLTGIFIAGWVLKSFEVMLLCVSLNYQRKYRSGNLVDVEMSRYNQRRREEVSFGQAIKKTLLSQETFFVIHFLITTSFLVSAAAPMFSETPVMFYCFLSAMLSQALVSIFVGVLIAKNKNTNGPKWATKVLVMLALLCSLPATIPNYYWNCLCNGCVRHSFTCYDTSVFCSLLSLVLFFLFLRAEFIRLNQESRWAVVGEVQSMFNVDN